MLQGECGHVEANNEEPECRWATDARTNPGTDELQ